MKTALAVILLTLVLLAGFFGMMDLLENPCSGFRGKTLTRAMYSQFVRDTFKLVIYLPKSYDNGTAKRYPVVYQLDGSYYGKSTAIILAHYHCKGIIPTEAIVVGIGYYYDGWLDKRNRDFIFVGLGRETPTNNNANLSGTGGGLKFYQFLKNELVPYIDSNFRTRNKTFGRTLMGHSLGGYFTLFTVFDQFKYTSHQLEKGSEVSPDIPVFANFIAASPVIVNELSYLTELERNAVRAYSGRFPVSIYMAISNTEEVTPIRYFPLLSRKFEQWQFPGFRFGSMMLENMEHTRTAVPIFKEGLKFIFSR